jgi:hypothetical protein
MANTFGHLYRVTTWGESHGGGVGAVIDGCPPQIPLAEADIQPDLDRRRPGQSKIVTPRKEADRCEILSGVFGGKTLGTPISVWVRNEDARPEAYKEMETMFRPSHADYTYQAKFGIRNWQGGGRTSAPGDRRIDRQKNVRPVGAETQPDRFCAAGGHDHGAHAGGSGHLPGGGVQSGTLAGCQGVG